MTTVHAVTATQFTVDGPSKKITEVEGHYLTLFLLHWCSKSCKKSYSFSEGKIQKRYLEYLQLMCRS